VYIGILIFYFAFIFFLMPETKCLTSEEAARVFDHGQNTSCPALVADQRPDAGSRNGQMDIESKREVDVQPAPAGLPIQRA
jgi:hypothetical protein